MSSFAAFGCSWRRVLEWPSALLLAAAGCTAEVHLEDAPDAEVDAAAPDPRCEIDLEVWTLEDATLVVPLVCASGRELGPVVPDHGDLPEGAELDSASAELRWTPNLAQAGNYVINLILSRGERAFVRIGVADRFEHPDNEAVVDPLHYAYELGVPVFHLGVSADIGDDDYTPATLIYAGREYAAAAAKYRGSTSRDYPKRSFTLKFDKGELFEDAPRGFPRARRLVLTTTFDDNSCLRQRLAFELWNRASVDNIPIRHFNAVVYLNGHYQGVYEVSDHVNADFLRDAGVAPSASLYKARKHDANFRLSDNEGEPKKRLRAGYTKEAGLLEPDSDGAYEELEELVAWIATASDDDFYADYPQRFSADFERWLMLVSLIAAVDTTKKNYFLVHDPSADAPDPRWRLLPWDFNASFGQTTRTLRRGPETYTLEKIGRSNQLFQRLLGDARLRAVLMERYRAALHGPWEVGRVLTLLDDYASGVGAAAERDQVRWDVAYRAYWSERTDFNDHASEVAFLREWIPARWTMIESQLR